MKSWKTTLGGLLSAIAIGLRHDAKTAPFADAVEAIGLALLGLSARDNGVSSEMAGVKPFTNVPVTVAQPPAK